MCALFVRLSVDVNVLFSLWFAYPCVALQTFRAQLEYLGGEVATYQQRHKISPFVSLLCPPSASTTDTGTDSEPELLPVVEYDYFEGELGSLLATDTGEHLHCGPVCVALVLN